MNPTIRVQSGTLWIEWVGATSVRNVVLSTGTKKQLLLGREGGHARDKKTRDLNASLGLKDEAGFTMVSPLKRTWARRDGIW